MVGLGETDEEVHALLRDLRAHDVDVATIGQYLQPTRRNLPVAEYVDAARSSTPIAITASRIGFKMVFSGPLVRSSYMADAVAEAAARHRRRRVRHAELAAGAGSRGGLLILVFPRFNLAWLAPFALTPLLIAAAREPRPWRRFLMGWACGIVFWFGVCYWIQFVLAFHGGLGDAAGLGRVHAVLPGQRRCTWPCSRCWPES